MNTQNNTPENIDLRMRTLRTLWFALLASVGVYFVFAMIRGRPENVQPNSTLSLALLGAGVLIALVSFVIKNTLVRQAVEREQVAQVQQAYIVAWAMSEVPALLGMLDFFVTSDRYYYVFFIVAVCAQLAHFPRREHVEQASFERR